MFSIEIVSSQNAYNGHMVNRLLHEGSFYMPFMITAKTLNFILNDHLCKTHFLSNYMSRDMRFPTM